MALDTIVIKVDSQADLDDTIKKLTELGVIDDKNAKAFQSNSRKQRSEIDQSKNKLGLFEKALNNIGPALAGAFAVAKIVRLGSAIIQTTAKFEKFEAVLTNTLGSKSEAQKALRDIQAFAANTPFGVSELTDSFVKLANQGFKPTQAEMRKLGDLAASTGKSFDQLTEAIIDAQTGEFERLKEFGIRASKEGDKVKFTFKGVETQANFTADAIRSYVLGLGDAVGVSGAMAAISETVGGKISNMGDAFDSLFNSLGSANSGLLKQTVELITSVVQGLEIALLTQEQLDKKLKGMEDDARLTQYLGFIEEDIKKLEQISEADEARRLVFAGQIIDLSKELELSQNLLAKHQRMFGETIDDSEKAILKEFTDDIAFYEAAIKKFSEGLTQIDKRTQERLKAEADAKKKREDEEKKTAEKRRKEAEERFKREVEMVKGKTQLELNIEKERYVSGVINKEQYDDAILNAEVAGLENLKKVYAKYHKDISDLDGQILDKRITAKEREADRLKKIQEEIEEEYEKAEKEIRDAFKETEEYKTKKAREEEEKRKRIRSAAIDTAQDIASQIATALEERDRMRTDTAIGNLKKEEEEQLKSLERRRSQGSISEEQYQKQRQAIMNRAARKEAELKTQQAKKERDYALFQIAINTAVAAIKAFPNLPLVALAIATGATEAAIVASKPIPKFKDGVIGYKGKGTGTSDSNLVRISNGESVMTAKETINYREELEAMRKGTYEKYRLPITRRQSLSESRHESMAESIFRAAMVQKGMDDSRIVSELKNRDFNIKNGNKLGSVIAAKLAERLAENNLYK